MQAIALYYSKSGVSEKLAGRICHGAKIQYPFDYGIIKKDNYKQWIENIKERDSPEPESTVLLYK